MKKKRNPAQLSLFAVEEDNSKDSEWFSPVKGIEEFEKLQAKILRRGKNIQDQFIICTYDISLNRSRNTLIKGLFRAGLYRVQKSVFMGEISEKSLRQLENECRTIMKELEENDHIMLIPLSEQQAFRIHVTGKSLDLNLLLNRRRVLFP
jgi:CRISPR-associated protein Cas2